MNITPVKKSRKPRYPIFSDDTSALLDRGYRQEWLDRQGTAPGEASDVR